MIPLVDVYYAGEDRPTHRGVSLVTKPAALSLDAWSSLCRETSTPSAPRSKDQICYLAEHPWLEPAAAHQSLRNSP